MQSDTAPFQSSLPTTSGRWHACTTQLAALFGWIGRLGWWVGGLVGRGWIGGWALEREASPAPVAGLRSRRLAKPSILVQVGLPFQCFVPWELMSFTLPEDEFYHNAAAALQKIVAQVTPAAERRMRELLAHFARDLLWRTDARRVSENILLEAVRARTRPPASGDACCPVRDRTDWPTRVDESVHWGWRE